MNLFFSDVYRSVNYIGTLAKFTWIPSGSFTLHATHCSLHFDKPQKNEIHSLNKRSQILDVIQSDVALYSLRH